MELDEAIAVIFSTVPDRDLAEQYGVNPSALTGTRRLLRAMGCDVPSRKPHPRKRPQPGHKALVRDLRWWARREVALTLTRDMGHTHASAGEVLGITRQAVSMIIRGKR